MLAVGRLPADDTCEFVGVGIRFLQFRFCGLAIWAPFAGEIPRPAFFTLEDFSLVLQFEAFFAERVHSARFSAYRASFSHDDLPL